MAPDPSAKKTQSRNNLTKKKDKRIAVKVMPLPEEPREGFVFPKNLRRPTLSRIRMEYTGIDGTVTMLLRVVAPQTPCDDRWILRRPPNLTYFLLASPNLEDEIHFKGGRFVTSQNSKFWNVILNK